MSTDKNLTTSKKKLGKGKLALIIVASIIVLIVAVCVVNAVVTGKDGMPPRVFGYGVFTITNEFMQGNNDDSIQQGSLIVTQELDPDGYAVNDIITYVDGVDASGRLLMNTQRITKIENSADGISYQAMSDNGAYLGTTIIGGEKIIGKVVFSSMELGQILSFFQSTVGIIVLITAVLSIVLIILIVRLVKLNKQEKAIEEDEFYENNIEEKSNPLGALPHELLSNENSIELYLNDEAFAEKKQEDSELDKLENWAEVIPPVEDEIEAPKPIETIEAVLSEAPPAPIIEEYDAVNLEELKQEDLAITKEYIPGMTKLNSNYVESDDDEELLRDEIIAEQEEDVSYINDILNNSPEASPKNGNEASAFSAKMNVDGGDNFVIDGINVNVKPQVLKIALDDVKKGGEISITVTKDYTSVSVDQEDNEINFALFKDETDEDRVIIQKKNKSEEDDTEDSTL